jgi:hypothetical protein
MRGIFTIALSMVFVFVFVSVFVSERANAGVIGIDDRVEASQTSLSYYRKSVGAIVPANTDIQRTPHHYMFYSNTLKQMLEPVWQRPICPQEKFLNQPTVARCSGVLIGEDVFLTARHCIFNQLECQKTLIAFDYENTSGNRFILSNHQVFRCAQILKGSAGYGPGNDWVIVKLEKPALQRPLIRIAKAAQPNQWATAIGTPTGLPLKAMPGRITAISTNVISGHFDGYVYASGSPLFNTSGELLGLLTNTPSYDYEISPSGCVQSKVIATKPEHSVIFQNVIHLNIFGNNTAYAFADPKKLFEVF